MAQPRRVQGSARRTRSASARRRMLRGGRVAAVALAVLVLAGGAYAAALETSVFAVQRLVVVGGTPRVQDELRAALAPELGRSLVRIDSAEIDRRIERIPDLVAVTYDRQFPHTLHVTATAERPVLLLRRGADTWLVSARGRVMRELRSPRRSSLPRLWVARGTAVSVGAILPPRDGGEAAAALAPLAPRTFPSRVRAVRAGKGELAFVLASGFEVRLGDLGDLRLKFAIARRILAAVHADPGSDGYLDVSVPERPVIAGPNAQLSS